MDLIHWIRPECCLSSFPPFLPRLSPQDISENDRSHCLIFPLSQENYKHFSTGHWAISRNSVLSAGEYFVSGAQNLP